MTEIATKVSTTPPAQLFVVETIHTFHMRYLVESETAEGAEKVVSMQPDERDALVMADKTQVRRLGCQHPIRPERESDLAGKGLATGRGTCLKKRCVELLYLRHN